MPGLQSTSVILTWNSPEAKASFVPVAVKLVTQTYPFKRRSSSPTVVLDVEASNGDSV